MKKYCIWTKGLTWIGNLMTRQNGQLWHNYCKKFIFQVFNNKQISKKGNTLRGWCSQRDDRENHRNLNQYKRCAEAMKTWDGVKTKHWQVSPLEWHQPWSNVSLFYWNWYSSSGHFSLRIRLVILLKGFYL